MEIMLHPNLKLGHCIFSTNMLRKYNIQVIGKANENLRSKNPRRLFRHCELPNGKGFSFYLCSVSNTCPINNRERRRGRKRGKGGRGVRDGGREVHYVTVVQLTLSL